MKTVGELFDLWDTIPEAASDIGVPHWRASKWKQRNRIPNKAWPDVMTAVRRKGRDLSAEDLLVMHARRRSGGSTRAGR